MKFWFAHLFIHNLEKDVSNYKKEDLKKAKKSKTLSTTYFDEKLDMYRRLNWRDKKLKKNIWGLTRIENLFPIFRIKRRTWKWKIDYLIVESMLAGLWACFLVIFYTSLSIKPWLLFDLAGICWMFDFVLVSQPIEYNVNKEVDGH